MHRAKFTFHRASAGGLYTGKPVVRMEEVAAWPDSILEWKPFRIVALLHFTVLKVADQVGPDAFRFTHNNSINEFHGFFRDHGSVYPSYNGRDPLLTVKSSQFISAGGTGSKGGDCDKA